MLKNSKPELSSASRRQVIISAGGVAATAVCGVSRARASAKKTIYYPSTTGVDAAKTLPYQVLLLILSKSGAAYDVQPSPLGNVTQQRATEVMAADGQIDVNWIGSSRTVDEKLTALPIPIEGGLLGYRLFLIDDRRQSEFERIHSLVELKAMAALQGAGWPDVDVLRGAGLRVRTGDYDNLFRMVMAGRGDYFPRGAFEIFTEQAKRCKELPNLAVESSLVLKYKFPMIFYLKKSGKALYDDLYRGFLAAYDDGSYKNLFLNHPDVKQALGSANLNKRTIIEIDNPNLSAQTKAISSRFWYNV